MSIEFRKKVVSKIDNVIKYQFLYKEFYIIEFSYINKKDGKDIICASCQTMCIQRCKFCHTNDYIGKIKCENIDAMSIFKIVNYIAEDQQLNDNKRGLLISYMGCGEPMANVRNVIDSMRLIYQKYSNSRFAVATSIPKKYMEKYIEFCSEVYKYNLVVKLHLSLHHTDPCERKILMPNSCDLDVAVIFLDLYIAMTKNKIEVHYTLIDDVNDHPENFWELAKMFGGKNINIKFLLYNKRRHLKYQASFLDKLKNRFSILDKSDVNWEYYIPPGLDIGASCGQFLLEVDND